MKTTRFNYKHLYLSIALAMYISPAISEDTIVVTASGYEQQIKSAPASISVINREELSNKPFRDLTDALKDIPGVVVTGSGTNTDISIRGMGASYTLILIDGKRQNSRETRPNSDGPGVEQGWIPPLSAIERIEVIRGPMSSLYGSDAMGGVINIITRKVSKNWGGSIRMDMTKQHDKDAGDPTNAELYLNGPLINDILGVQISGKYSHRPEDKKMGGFSEQNLNSVNSKFSYTPTTSQTVELELGGSIQKRESTTATSNRPSAQRSRRENQSIRHKGTWGSSVTDFFVTHENTDNYSRDMKIDNTNVNGQVLLPFESHMLTLGASYRYEKLNDNSNKFDKSKDKITRWSYAFAADDEWRILDRFALTGGLRFDYDENFSEHWSPRLYAVFDVTDTLVLKGGVTTGYKTPSLRQVVSDWGQPTGGGRSNGVILGSPDLKPEKSVGYETSLNYYNEENQINSSLTGFYTRFKDKIQSRYLCQGPSGKNTCIASNNEKFDFIQEWENVDKATLHGTEFSLKIPLISQLSLSNSYAWTKTKQKSGPNKGMPLNRIPEHRVVTSLDWKINDSISTWLKSTYNGKEARSTRKSNTTQTSKYPGFTTWDVGASWKVHPQTSMYGGIYNLTDKKINDDTVGKDQDGLRYWIGLNVDF